MPVAEALAIGTPVIAADIAALREVGRHAPDYLDPIDGASWIAAIKNYAQPDSPRRKTQLRRLDGWQPATWDQHIAIVLDLINSL